jgi:hypothetical protein
MEILTIVALHALLMMTIDVSDIVYIQPCRHLHNGIELLRIMWAQPSNTDLPTIIT